MTLYCRTNIVMQQELFVKHGISWVDVPQDKTMAPNAASLTEAFLQVCPTQLIADHSDNFRKRTIPQHIGKSLNNS